MYCKKIMVCCVSLSILFNQTMPIFASTRNTLNNTDNYTISEKKVSFDLSQYPENIQEAINMCLTLLEKYGKTKNEEYLHESFLYFSAITAYIKDTPIVFKDGDVFDYIFYTSRNYIYNISDLDLQHASLTYFAENIFIGWRKNKNITVFKNKYLIKELVEYNNGKNYLSQNRLNYLKFLCEYLEKNPDSEDADLNKIPSIEQNPIPDNNTPLVPPSNNTGNSTDNSPEHIGGGWDDVEVDDNIVSNDTEGYFIEYVKEGNECVKVKTYYKNGQAVSSEKFSISKLEYVKCGIYDYINDGVFNDTTIEIDKDYIQNDQNLISDYTIHYTINKNSKKPYYFDTGIRATFESNTITYNQLKDALYQLAIKSDGFFIKDNNKSLVILEGKPLVITKEKETYSKDNAEMLLNSFLTVGLKIMEFNNSKPDTLESYLSNKRIDTIKLNGKQEKLNAPFILVENQLFGPIQDIVRLLGAETKLSDNKLTIIKDSTTIELDFNSKSYFVNRQEKLFASKPKITNSSVYSEIDAVISILGYELIWDSEAEQVIIKNKK